ncbi:MULTISPECIES: acyl carrier protein [unclassified Streptomyces]|uniref:acyl carrier protein n=1 Tax=unclassified Streptomyces TaxID=2593676 RepID=UPI00081DA845|nr:MULTISPECIES: acyl carrier protein [unclassified Streptomyces]SCD81694.1 Acyl carrier protein [Streptomyces sp. ScaeMP-e83]
MERQELLLTIEKALSEVLERPISGLTEETALFDELQLTSIAVLGMLMSVEEATGISVDPEGLDIDDLRTLGSFADYVEAAIRAEGVRDAGGAGDTGDGGDAAVAAGTAGPAGAADAGRAGEKAS